MGRPARLIKTNLMQKSWGVWKPQIRRYPRLATDVATRAPHATRSRRKPHLGPLKYASPSSMRSSASTFWSDKAEGMVCCASEFGTKANIRETNAAMSRSSSRSPFSPLQSYVIDVANPDDSKHIGLLHRFHFLQIPFFVKTPRLGRHGQRSQAWTHVSCRRRLGRNPFCESRRV